MHQGNRYQTQNDGPVAINGHAIKAIRELVGLKRPELARSVKASASYIAKIETGTRNHVDKTIVALIAQALSVSPLALLAHPQADAERVAA